MIEGRWAEAAKEWQGRGATYLRAAALGQGDEPAADEALRTLTRLGAVAAAEHLRADLRRRGVTYASRGPRRVTSGDSAGLTPRQLDVLRAVAEGLSDADIADRLTLSTKTVSHHMSAILRKLEVTSRGQAAAKAHRLGLTGHDSG
jgi:DNA-binding NarL/FixJ family response regulator